MSSSHSPKKSPPRPSPLSGGFRLFLVGAFISNLGTWVQAVAVGWLVAELTRDPIWAGVIAFSAGVPILLLSLLGGLIADHFDRRKFLMLTQSVLLVAATVLSALDHFHLVRLWHLVLISVFAGVATALNNPVYSGFLFDMVGKGRVARAVSLNSAQLHLSRALGPLIGGLAIGWVGTSGCFALNALSFLAVIPVIAAIPLAEARRTIATEFRVRKKLAEAFAFVRSRTPLLLALTVLAWTSLSVNPHLSLLPIYLRNSLGFSAAYLGRVWAFSGFGSITTTLIYGRFFHDREPRFYFWSCWLGSVLCGAGLWWLSYTRSPVGIAVELFALGMALTLVSLSCQILLHLNSPEALRGRLLSIWNLGFQGMFPIGNLVFGALAERTSIPLAWRIAGLGLGIVVTLVSILAVYIKANKID